MTFVYNDGGREEAGFKGKTGDCACRAAAIAMGRPYAEVYAELQEFAKTEKSSKRKKSKSNARTGYYKDTFNKYLETHNWKWYPTMVFGEGCTTHLKAEELPSGNIIARVTRHYVAVIDGVIHDTHDASRNGTRCVYGYWATKTR